MLAVLIRQQQQCKDRFATRNMVLVLYRFEFELLDFFRTYPLEDILERSFRLVEIRRNASNIKNLFVFAAT